MIYILLKPISTLVIFDILLIIIYLLIAKKQPQKHIFLYKKSGGSKTLSLRSLSTGKVTNTVTVRGQSWTVQDKPGQIPQSSIFSFPTFILCRQKIDGDLNFIKQIALTFLHPKQLEYYKSCIVPTRYKCLRKFRKIGKC